MGGGSTEVRSVSRAQRILGEGMLKLQERVDKLEDQLGESIMAYGGLEVRVEALEARVDALELAGGLKAPELDAAVVSKKSKRRKPKKAGNDRAV